jgi:hypothetical protein
MIEKGGDKYWCVFVEEILWAPHEKSGRDIIYPTLCSEDIRTVIFFLLPWCKSLRWARAFSLLRLHDHTHWDTLHLVGIPSKSDQTYAKASSWQHTTVARDRHPCPRQDSYQQASGHRPRLRDHWDRFFFFSPQGSKTKRKWCLETNFVRNRMVCMLKNTLPSRLHTYRSFSCFAHNSCRSQPH